MYSEKLFGLNYVIFYVFMGCVLLTDMQIISKIFFLKMVISWWLRHDMVAILPAPTCAPTLAASLLWALMLFWFFPFNLLSQVLWPVLLFCPDLSGWAFQQNNSCCLQWCILGVHTQNYPVVLTFCLAIQQKVSLLIIKLQTDVASEVIGINLRCWTVWSVCVSFYDCESQCCWKINQLLFW